MTEKYHQREESVAVVTGAASGIGRAAVDALLEGGAYVVAVDLDGTRLQMLANRNQHVSPVIGDVSEWETCRRAAYAAQLIDMPVKTLVNSAAYFGSKGSDASAADWDRSLSVNVKGSALMASAMIPLLQKARPSTIVNIASISAHIAQPNRWTYNSTKGAILSLTRCQALDLAEYGIRVNSVSPATIWTEELDRMTGGDRSTWGPVFGAHHMLGRVGEPSEVASVIMFLSSEASSFITGADIATDGGYLSMGHDNRNLKIEYSEGE